jgi:hypothetical protein
VEPLDRDHAFIGRFNEWSNWFRLEVDIGVRLNDPAQVRAQRDSTHASAAAVFDRWQRTPASMADAIREESEAFGAGIWRQCARMAERVAAGHTDLDTLLDAAVLQMRYVREGLGLTEGVTKETIEQLQSFLRSEAVRNIPANKISAALYGFEAYHVGCGAKRPESSFWLDIEMISAALPYCDAMLIEGHFAEGLKQTRKYLPDTCRQTPVYSTRRLTEFTEYLDSVIVTVPPDQRAAAEALYRLSS